METYFLITTQDSNTYVEALSKKQLEERLGEDAYWQFVKTTDNECDTQCWDGNALIIKGEIVVPKPKEREVVKKQTEIEGWTL